MTDKRVAAGLEPGTHIGNQEAGSPATPAAKSETQGKGQKISQERGSATNSKKNPGKRPSQGGN